MRFAIPDVFCINGEKMIQINKQKHTFNLHSG